MSALPKWDKFEQLRQRLSLQDYLLVAQDHFWASDRHRRAENCWDLIDANRADDQIVLESIEMTLSVSEIYERVALGA